jgi:hypothetical protein
MVTGFLVSRPVGRQDIMAVGAGGRMFMADRRERERERTRPNLLRCCPLGSTSSSQAPSPKVSRPFQNSTTSWDPSVPQ